jgi:hypothetical protein
MLSEDIENIDKNKSSDWSLLTGATRPAKRRGGAGGYQACWARQCGQATVVETGAQKTKPHEHA